MNEFLKCGFCHFEMDEEDEASYSCKNEAKFSCCDYGGHVCEEHKCRCSKPLTEENIANFIRKNKEWQCMNVLQK